MASGWFRIDGVSHRNKQNIIQKIMSWWIWVWGIIHFASSSARCLIILIRQPKKLSGFFTSTNSWDVEAFSTRALLFFYWLIFFMSLDLFLQTSNIEKSSMNPWINAWIHSGPFGIGFGSSRCLEKSIASFVFHDISSYHRRLQVLLGHLRCCGEEWTGLDVVGKTSDEWEGCSI